MKIKIIKILIIIAVISVNIPVFSQDSSMFRPDLVIDSLRKSGMILKETPQKPEIFLSDDEALKFLQQRYQLQYWKKSNDPLRLAIERLIFEVSNQSFDTTEKFLSEYPFDSIDIPWERFYIWKPFTIEFPADHVIHSSDSAQIKGDTIVSVVTADSLVFTPVTIHRDTTLYYVEDTLDVVGSESEEIPFVYYDNPYQDDSLRVAVNSLIEHLHDRDSSIINITGSGDTDTYIWLNSKAGMMQRYWLKNELNDSVTVWIGSPERNTIGLYLEQGVDFRRTPRQQNYANARIEVKEVDKKTLQDVSGIVVKKRYWKYRTEASFALNQSSLTNWVKGGESSISTSMDITGYADYENKEIKTTSANFGRLKFGLIWTDEKGIRKNLDLLETNSKLNHKAFGKFDFSGILLLKSQIAEGKSFSKINDRDTSIVVSKFFNPATITLGFGLDYKPNKNTSINFSPLSYKGTFVPDTANIDQTKYGVAADRRSKHEPGFSFMITNKYTPWKTVTVTNRLQLFTNYINKPQNIDIDWEMIVTASLNWFTDVRLNTHFIYDDDTKTPVFNKDKEPVMLPDGKQKTTARAQFKEILGFSFVFRF